MESKDIKAEFSGFGPIPSSKTTFSQGIGLGGSFAPIWTTEPKLPEKRQPTPTPTDQTTYPFHLTVVTEDGSKVRVQYGEIDGVPPNGMSLESDYLLGPGYPFIYLVVTFDGDGRINSRTIGCGSPVPDDTDDTKHIVIGEVAYNDDVYTIVNQNISQDIYTEKALVVDRSNESFVYSLFADPRKINAIYEYENFNVNLDGENLTTTLYLKKENNQDYVELKKDSTNGEVALYGYVNNEAQNFILSSNDTAGQSKLQLFDSESTVYLESKVDTVNQNTSVYGYVNNEAQNFILSSNDTDGQSKLQLFASESTVYLESKVDTVNQNTSVYGYVNNEAQNFLLKSDGLNDKSYLRLYDSNSGNYLSMEEKYDTVSVYGYMNNQNHNFKLNAQAGKSQLELYNQASDAYVNLKQNNSECSLYAYVENEEEYFILKAKSEDTQLYLSSGSNYVKLDIPDNNGTLLNAFWQEIDVCVNGVSKKMKVLGTEPY